MMTVVDDIKAQIDIVDIVSETVKLRHTGKNYTGFCPFHPNTRTPAFVVFPGTQTWRCFGQCNEGGDVFGFVMKKEGWGFSEALRYLAERAGVQLKPFAKEDEVAKDAREQLSAVLEEAASFYRQQMLETRVGLATLEYLHGRGLNDQTIKIFGLGHAPDAWDVLNNHLTNKGYSEQLLLDAGLTSERDSGGSYDRFRNRLTIPIHDAFGKMVGFGGRVLNPEDVPKYLNSPKTELFDKGRLLYGLDAARHSIREKDQAVIVEGYLDVIALHQAGFTNTISPMGTALTEAHFRLMKKFTRRIILALDPDAAGEKATLRGLETARQTMDQDPELRFDARGLLYFEARLKADIRVTTLPDGKDPDEIVLEDPQIWAQILENAKPIVVHVMETLAAEKDITDAKVKSQVAERVLPLIEDVADHVEREAYRQKLAHLIKVDERALASTVSSSIRVRRRPTGLTDPTPISTKIKDIKRNNRILERYSLQYFLQNPEDMNYLDRILRGYELSEVSNEDFIESDFLEAYKIVRAALDQDEYTPGDYIQRYMPETIAEALEPDASDEPVKDIQSDKLRSELVRTILRMRRNRLDEQLEEILYVQNSMTEVPEEISSSCQDLVTQQILLRKRIDDALQPSFSPGKSENRSMI
ncbi:MAG: DNA primase [Chloroflexota bacterium]